MRTTLLFFMALFLMACAPSAQQTKDASPAPYKPYQPKPELVPEGQPKGLAEARGDEYPGYEPDDRNKPNASTIEMPDVPENTPYKTKSYKSSDSPSYGGKVCTKGCACGNTCISCSKTCRVGSGRARNGYKSKSYRRRR